MIEKDRLDRIRNKAKAERLFENKDFMDIILVEYMNKSIHELMYREGSSIGVRKGIDARKSLNDFLYAIIEEGKVAEEQ